MKNQIIFRPMSEADIPAVFKIEQEAYSHPWTLGIIKSCLKVDYNNIVLQINNHIVGYSFISVQSGEAHLLNLTIKKSEQNKGLGTKLLYYQLAQAKNKKAEIIFLEVRRSNHIAQNLYLKIGFNEVGCRHHYYPTQTQAKEDAIIFALSL